ncbi:MAG: NAD-binding protein [Anaerolineales bacterium]|nr:NAD-binding protein [Anaerolineales bacterium]
MYVILIGGGKTTYFLAQQFASKGYETAIICPDAAEARWLSRHCKSMVLVGNGSKSALLEDAGARQASAVVALLPADQDNLIACQLATRKFGVPRTIALIQDPANEEIFTRLGVSVAVSAARILTQLIEEQVGFEEIINLMPLSEGRLTLTEVVLTEKAPAIGQTLHQLQFPPQTLVAAVLRGEEVIIPRGDTHLELYDRLLVLTLPSNQAAALTILLGEA